MSRTPVDESAQRTEWIRKALEEHEAPLLRYVGSLTGDPESARDIVQDTFLRLCGQQREEVGKHLAQWLFTVARNRALDRLRKEGRMAPLTEEELESRPAQGPSPSTAAENRDSTRNLLALVDRLPPNQREVVRLKFQNQLSYQEISELTALSVGNVGFLLHTALKTLRQQMSSLDRPSRLARG
jgi:RNA polymerase sigma-70 factor (ECF subfamily)